MHPSLRALLALAALLIAPATAAAAPSITLTTPGDDAVYATTPAVLADYVCAPDASTLAAVTQCDGTVANGAAIDTATAGTKVFTITATDADGATTTVTHTYVVDSTAPAIALDTPAQGAVFASGEVVNATYTCADLGGAGLASCTGTVPNGQPIDTSAGAHTFTVTAIDTAGNATTVTHSYRASICSRTGAHAVTCELWARAGTIDLPGMSNIPTKTFADHGGAPAITQIGGPTLDALAGDTVSVILHNDLSEPLALAVPQQPMAPADTKIAPGGQATYSFVARLGTSIYEAGSATSVAALDENVAKQVAQGLYGALVVRPAAETRQAYGTAATAYDEEALMLLSDIDPALNANPDTFDMTAFAPRYALINGRPYDGTPGGTLPIVSAPGHDVLLRIVNAAVRFHPIGLLGLRESVVGESSHALLYPRSAISTTVAPGSTADALVHLPTAASAAGHYALYDTGLRLYNGTQAGFGGMLTTIDATGTWTTTCAGPVTTRVQAPDSTTAVSDLTFSAYVTPCAAAPATTISAAEYFIDVVGADGSGTALPLGPNPLAGTVTQAQLLGLAEGRHTIYVHGQDSTGAWGEVSSDTFAIARIGPVVRAIVLNPNPTNLEPPTTHLSATADVTAHAGRTVAAAEYFVDPAGPQVPGSGTALAVAGTAAIAALDGEVSLAGLTAGVHVIVIEAQDEIGNWGPARSIELVIDLAGPVTTSVTVSPNPNNGTLEQDGHPGVVWVTATITDGGPNPSHIKAAEGFIDPAGTPAAHNGWNLIPVDGQFDQSVEQAYAPIPLAEIAGLSDGGHVFSVRGQDAAGNWGALATGTLQIDNGGPVITAAALTSSTVARAGTVRLSATAADGSLVDRFEYFLDQGPATSVNVTPATPVSISNRAITMPFNATGALHYVYVRAHDGADNWGPWTQLALTVTNPLAPFGETGDLGSFSAPLIAPLMPLAGARVTVHTAGRAQVISVATTASGSIRARFAFAPRGIRIRGSQTILRGRDAAGHLVLWVQARGSAAHGYQLRAISGDKRSPWLSLTNRRAVLEAALRPGTRPTLTRAH
jgi:multicopper oxidase